ncbi:SSI family serine proteinase inhibitor [Pseudarthrobacter sp. 1G09]|uniref:SSI family serine proteinase inhibitor n=1 Tax=Pseudarthrobacter sp. 1G09 TaxID=3416178 RepID=UPI003CF5D425
MRNVRLHLAALAVTAGLLSACTGGPDGGNPPPSSTSPAQSPTSSATSSATAPPSTATPSPDTETSVPAPPPASPSALPAGPGQGNAELAITVIPAEGQAAVNYTLVCDAGVPAGESSHPTADAACAALKRNAALLNPGPRTAQACTQQYGGPEKATVTGVVDGTAVEASFARTDGCEISAWDAAKDILGRAGGAT